MSGPSGVATPLAPAAVAGAGDTWPLCPHCRNAPLANVVVGSGRWTTRPTCASYTRTADTCGNRTDQTCPPVATLHTITFWPVAAARCDLSGDQASTPGA